MQTTPTTLLLTLLQLTLALAAPTPRLAPSDANPYSFIPSTLPTSSICGTSGLVPSTLLSTHPSLTLSTLKGLHDVPTCASHCLSRTGCASFAYNQVNGSCALYTETVADMGFRRNSGAVFWWDRNCFERHGDWMGVVDDREGMDGGRSGTGRTAVIMAAHRDGDKDADAPVRDASTKISSHLENKTDVEILDEAEDALLAAPYPVHVRRPAEVQFARDRAAARIAAAAAKVAAARQTVAQEKNRMVEAQEMLVMKGGRVSVEAEQKKLAKRSFSREAGAEHRLASRRRPAFGDVKMDAGF